MHDNFEVDPAVLKAKITGETARIHWHELQKFYAAGSVVVAAPAQDLVEIAFALATDQKELVASWLASGQLWRATEQEALSWYDANTELWAVVVSPWVLVQHNDSKQAH